MTINLENIYVERFRNIDKCELIFSPKINCIFGRNGNGKTNLLEAIFFSVFKKSFRKNVKKSQLIKRNSEYFIIKSNFETNDKKINHSMKISEGENLIYVDKVKTTKLNRIHAVPINPYDAFLYHSQNSVRRDLLNHKLSSTDPTYSIALKEFSKALRMRNTLLSKHKGSKIDLKRQIRGIDEIISTRGLILIKQRKLYCENISPVVSKLFNELFNEHKKINFNYISEFKDCEKPEEIFQFYQDNIERDIMMRSTKKGIHLDNYQISLDESDCAVFGSIGQQKVSYLSLMFSYVEYLEKSKKSSPILLLDDISGELDSECWKNLLKYLSNKDMQVFISTANDSFYKDLTLFEDSKMFEVKHGAFTELKL